MAKGARERRKGKGKSLRFKSLEAFLLFNL
jgi:hypothetical protein